MHFVISCHPALLPALFLVCPFWHLPFTLFKNIHSCWIFYKMKTVKSCKMFYTNIKWGKRNAFWLRHRGIRQRAVYQWRLLKHLESKQICWLSSSRKAGSQNADPAFLSFLTYAFHSLIPAYSGGPALFQTWLQKLGNSKVFKIVNYSLFFCKSYCLVKKR